MELTNLYIGLVIGAISAIAGFCMVFFNGSIEPDRRDAGAVILTITIIALIIVMLVLGSNFSPIQKPDLIRKGLVAMVIEQPDNTFFIKTPKEQVFLIHPSKKGKKIPVVGDKVVFTGDSYEIVSDE